LRRHNLWREFVQHLDETLLRDLPSFRALEPLAVREILSHAHSRRIEAGHSVFEEGAEAETFFLLLDGHIRVERISREGDRVIPLHIPPGQLFGIAAALGRDTYPATAVAAAECIVLCWPMRLWDSFVETYPGFGREANKMVGHRVGEMNARIMELATQHVEQRVASAILRLSQQNGRQTDTGVEIPFPLTRRQISEMTGSTLHTVSRLLSAWERDGILTSERKHIRVHEPTRLAELTEDTKPAT
jgi:CRP-like cAMP-binding protein